MTRLSTNDTKKHHKWVIGRAMAEKKVSKGSLPMKSKLAPSVPRYMPDARECALLLLRLIEAKANGTAKPLSRFRVAELSLRRMWGRQHITREFIGDVNEWLFRAGRVLFFAGNSYGVISVNVVESWSGLTSKLISSETNQALAGAFDFTSIEGLLNAASGDEEDDS